MNVAAKPRMRLDKLVQAGLKESHAWIGRALSEGKVRLVSDSLRPRHPCRGKRLRDRSIMQKNNEVVVMVACLSAHHVLLDVVDMWSCLVSGVGL